MNSPYADVDWQRPVITELAAATLILKNEKLNKKYQAIPWATLVDLWSNLFKGDPRKDKALNYLENIPYIKNSFTVCQTYRFKQLLPFFKKAGITTVFTPHAEEEVLDGIKVKPFPLYDPLKVDPIKERKIIYSFVGMHRSDYVSAIRQKIFRDSGHPRNSLIMERQRWHYDNAVYAEQIQSLEKNALSDIMDENNREEYKEVLSNSRYSLCPGGVGPSSIRFYESLRAGAIPILLSDKMKLPEIKGLNWENCILKTKERDYNLVREKINSIKEEQENEMRENCYKAYKEVSGENFIKCVRNYYEQQ
ncbi:MAG: hypothetical protein EBY39_05505 [Flavobacteriia bacterium]|nr:hypothetical protein [Flavobacteriia bacterium]